MIKTELINNGHLIRTYSDSGMYLLQTDTGIVYGEAIDVYPTSHVYAETDPPAGENDSRTVENILKRLENVENTIAVS